MKTGFRRVIEEMLLEGVETFVDFVDWVHQSEAEKQENLANLRFIAFMLQTKMVSAIRLEECLRSALLRKGFGISMALRQGERSIDEAGWIALHYTIRHGRLARTLFEELDPPVAIIHQRVPAQLKTRRDLARELVDWLSAWDIFPMADPVRRRELWNKLVSERSKRTAT